MKVSIDGRNVSLDGVELESPSKLLSQINSLIEEQGRLVTSLEIDGVKANDENVLELLDSKKGISTFVLSTKGSLEAREEHFRVLIAILELCFDAATGSLGDNENIWDHLRKGWKDIGVAADSFFSPDERAMHVSYCECLESRTEITNLDEKTKTALAFFKSRFEEMLNPEANLAALASIFGRRKSELTELSVLLQTGKDDRAIASILVFTEMFSSMARLVHNILATNKAAFDNFRIDGVGLEPFFESFNAILGQLCEAFEKRDIVLLGDLAEYEILPKAEAFFAQAHDYFGWKH